MEALEALGWILVGFVVTMVVEIIALWYFVLKDLSMKIYIATPVNARKEPTLQAKQAAALKRVNELTRIVQTHLPKAKVRSVFNAIVVRKNGQPVSEDKIMGACVRMVMTCDVILMDDGWGDSHGCKVERFTAQEYGKEIWTLFDLEGLKSK